MTSVQRSTRVLVAALAVVQLLSCADQPPPEVHFLSNDEFDKVWKSAESRTPIGAATIRRSLGVDGEVNVTCQQAFTLRMNNGGSSTGTRCCEMACKLLSGATFGDCQTSGCALPFDDSPPSDVAAGCSAASCSGGCVLLRACQPCTSGPIIVGRRPA